MKNKALIIFLCSFFSGLTSFAQVNLKVKTLPPIKKVATKPKLVKVRNQTYPHFSLYLTSNAFTNLKYLGGEIEYRGSNFGLGAFYQSVKFNDTESFIQVNGSNIGLIAHYRFLPLYEILTYRKFDGGLFVSVGEMKLASSTQGSLPTYLSSSLGLDGSYSFLVKPLNLGLYGRAAADYIYHASTGVLYLGPEVSLGLKLSF